MSPVDFSCWTQCPNGAFAPTARSTFLRVCFHLRICKVMLTKKKKDKNQPSINAFFTSRSKNDRFSALKRFKSDLGPPKSSQHSSQEASTEDVIDLSEPQVRPSSFLSQEKRQAFDEVPSNILPNLSQKTANNFKKIRIQKQENSVLDKQYGAPLKAASDQRKLPWEVPQFSWSRKKDASSGIKNPRMASKAIPTIASKISLTKEQEKVLSLVVDDGLNIFYTGSAGTGKSVVLRELVQRLNNLYGPDKVGVTASTGLAAVNIGGQTINRWAGIGIGKQTPVALAGLIKKNGNTYARWRNVKVLIMDEVSMIDGVLFSKLNEVAQIVRKNQLPFGGIQVVLTGDFFQLPPVPDKDTKMTYCFQSECWDSVINKTILLKQVFRQTDMDLIDMLNALREGHVYPEIIQQFSKLGKEVVYTDGIEPTELYATRNEVEAANKSRLAKLEGPLVTYTAKDVSDRPDTPPYIMKLLNDVMAPSGLQLKEGCQVMMLKNKDEELVNGTLGKVQCFMTSDMWHYIQTQLTTVDLLQEDVIKELNLVSKFMNNPQPDESLFRQLDTVSPHRKQIMDELITIARTRSDEVLPLVQFAIGSRRARFELIQREEFPIDVKNNNVRITRIQLPLLLSWALSIHKSQGQTLDRVKVDLRRTFADGQVYVALSRAVSKERLQIVGFHPSKIRASAVVKGFYEKLESV
ncbi:DNA helicase [Komagataella phaffii CBS 7435]|nr:DNA helicase [Komagataella phaffii CBS 7435]SCV12100.1 DNA helicase [Komagataella phaffii CBS 7435]